MAELSDKRIGTKATADAPRVRPDQDVLGKPVMDGATEVGIGHGHYVVVPVVAADHLIAAALETLRQVVADHYTPAQKTKKKGREVTDVDADETATESG